MEVRKATLEDAHWIAQQMKVFSDEYISEAPLYCEGHSESLIKDVIENHVCFVAEKAGELCGVVAGYVLKHIYNPNITQLVELVWWVPKEHRSSSIGLKLFEAYTAWGKEYVHWTSFSLPANVDASEDIFYKHGYKKLETNYFIERI